MDNIGEYVWAIFAIILTFASLFKGIGKRKPQYKTKKRSAEIFNEKDMPDITFDELRKSIAEAAKRSHQPQQTIVRQPKSDIQSQPKARSAKRSLSTDVNDNAQFAITRQFYTSATIKPTQAVKTTAKNQTDGPERKSMATELVNNKELSSKFNFRDAIVYSEIMKPKFED